jgi:pimeloyl-ACP methyl ester carboxylesterase
VIRFDQRDTGLSTWIDFFKTPYTLVDMAQDICCLLDVLNIDKAHIVGYSTGGLIAQLFAIHFPKRVLSLVLMMTSTDLTIKNDAFRGLDMSTAKLPPPKSDFIKGVLSLQALQQRDLFEKVSFLVESFRLSNGSKAAYDAAFFSKLFEKSFMRVDGKLKKGGHESNHALATSATPVIQEAEFAKIAAPTLVISRSEDPILPPAHGEAIHRVIKGSRLLRIEGMGHCLNPIFYEQIIEAMAHHMLSINRD